MGVSTKGRVRLIARFVILKLAWAALLLGCGLSTANLERHLNAGEFDRAVQEAKGKRKTELALAVLILEKHLREGGPPELVDTVSRAGKLGKRALKRLAEDKNAKVARLAQIALRHHKNPDVDEIMLVVNDADSDIRYACIRAWYRQMSLLVLKRALLDHDPRIRLYAVKGVAAIGMERDVSDLLREALRLDPSAKVRAEAALQGELLGADALLALKQALEDKSMGVKFAAIRGLAEMGSADALHMVEEIAVGPIDHAAVVAAAELARRAHPIGRERLKKALDDKRPGIRKTALMRLERAGLTERRALLRAHLKDDTPDVVLVSARLLENYEEARQEVRDALKPLLKEDHAKQVEALAILATIGDEAALKKAREVLTGDDAAEVTAFIKRAQRAPALRDNYLALMASPKQEIRIEAAKAIVFSQSKI